MADMSFVEFQKTQPYNDGKYRVTPSEYNAILDQCEHDINVRHNAARKRLKEDRDSAIVPINDALKRKMNEIDNKASIDRDRIHREESRRREELQEKRKKVGRNAAYAKVWKACALIPLLSFILVFLSCTLSCNRSSALEPIEHFLGLVARYSPLGWLQNIDINVEGLFFEVILGFLAVYIVFAGYTLAIALIYTIAYLVGCMLKRSLIDRQIIKAQEEADVALRELDLRTERARNSLAEENAQAIKRINDKYNSDSAALEATIQEEVSRFQATKEEYSVLYKKGYYEKRQTAMEAFIAELRQEQDNAVVWLSAEIIKELEQFWEKKQLDSFLKRCGYLFSITVTDGISYELQNKYEPHDKMHSNNSNKKYYSFGQADERVQPGCEEIELWGYCKALATLVNEYMCSWLNEVDMNGNCQLMATDKQLDQGKFTLDFDSSYT